MYCYTVVVSSHHLHLSGWNGITCKYVPPGTVSLVVLSFVMSSYLFHHQWSCKVLAVTVVDVFFLVQAFIFQLVNLLVTWLSDHVALFILFGQLILDDPTLHYFCNKCVQFGLALIHRLGIYTRPTRLLIGTDWRLMS